MTITEFNRRLRPWMLPIAMVIGMVFNEAVNMLQWIVPYLIFTMLLITFCRVKPSELRYDGMAVRLLIVQILGSAVLFFALQPFNLSLAQALMICVLCPTATAAPVVTGMLGGNIGRLASYSIVSNLAAAVFAPVMFVMAADVRIDFLLDFSRIILRVAPMIVVPLGLAWTLYYTMSPVHNFIARSQKISFYLWSVSLTLVVGKSVHFVMSEPPEYVPLMIAMGIGALVVCVAQFAAGRWIGRRYGDKISAAQGLGQKNTVLAIWLAITYLNPISSVAPAAYILWQNTINSVQLYFKMKNGASQSLN